jgi:hypothetical protein
MPDGRSLATNSTRTSKTVTPYDDCFKGHKSTNATIHLGLKQSAEGPDASRLAIVSLGVTWKKLGQRKARNQDRINGICLATFHRVLLASGFADANIRFVRVAQRVDAASGAGYSAYLQEAEYRYSS